MLLSTSSPPRLHRILSDQKEENFIYFDTNLDTLPQLLDTLIVVCSRKLYFWTESTLCSDIKLTYLITLLKDVVCLQWEKMKESKKNKENQDFTW